jgi:hypothetical protein
MMAWTTNGWVVSVCIGDEKSRKRNTNGLEISRGTTS